MTKSRWIVRLSSCVISSQLGTQTSLCNRVLCLSACRSLLVRLWLVPLLVSSLSLRGVATVMPKLRAVWTDATWISWRLCATLGVLRVAGSTFRGKVKDERYQDERVNVSSLTAIQVMLPQVLASWLGSAAAPGAALVWIIVVFSSVPPAAAQASSAWALTLEAGCKVLFGWICFYVSKALVSAAALVSSFKSLSGE